jgi:YafQ family addiction module toxin component
LRPEFIESLKRPETEKTIKSDSARRYSKDCLYSLEVVEKVDRIFKKLRKKDLIQFEAISKKVSEILENPQQFKPLKSPMQHMRRVHVGSFVLVYDIDEVRKAVIIRRYEHHDNVYK